MNKETRRELYESRLVALLKENVVRSKQVSRTFKSLLAVADHTYAFPPSLSPAIAHHIYCCVKLNDDKLRKEKIVDLLSTNCHEHAFSFAEIISIEGNEVIYSRKPGERDSFGWLCGVDRITIPIGESVTKVTLVWG